MTSVNHRYLDRITAWIITAAILLLPLTALAQTRLNTEKNNYTPAQDVQLGLQTAAQVQRQFSLLPRRSEVDNYVEQVGRRLVAAIPDQYQYPQFRYSFDVVNARDINAFALPGSPVYVNRGMIEAARSEGEVAGVMAHELAHVALRHGTAQATKAQSAKFQLPTLGGAILGAIVGGTAGSAISQGTQMGLGVYFLRFSREYEQQADILGAQIMARAGYDPHELANMFRTIEQQSGSGGPEWLSDHPNPGNRYQRINQEAARLGFRSSEMTYNTVAFNRVQSQLRRMPPAPTMEEIARSRRR